MIINVLWPTFHMIITISHKVWVTVLLPSLGSCIYAFRNEYVYTCMHVTKINENRANSEREKYVVVLEREEGNYAIIIFRND